MEIIVSGSAEDMSMTECMKKKGTPKGDER
jgi:hypothetical protein